MSSYCIAGPQRVKVSRIQLCFLSIFLQTAHVSFGSAIAAFVVVKETGKYVAIGRVGVPLGGKEENVRDGHGSVYNAPKKLCVYMMMSSNGNISALLGLCAGKSPVTGEFPWRRPVRRSMMFSLICAWINSWVNNLEVGDLRRHHAHYGVIVMISRIDAI